MPIIILTGLPCSGKSTRTEQLKTFLQEKHSVKVNVIDDQTLDVNKNDVYSDSKKEKSTDCALKSAIQRLINKEDVLILDSLNYIKGYRYELFCVTKSSQTPQCVIHCGIHKDVADDWNKSRSEAERYSQHVFDELVMRYEAPDSRNRWDSPLFLVHPEDSLPCDDIYDALYRQKAPKQNMSTQSQPMSSTNFLHELDKVTQAAVSVIMDAQKSCVPGDQIKLPDASEKVEFHRHLTLSELQRLRRQFISVSKLRPVEDNTRLANMFVQFLNNTLR